jgi:hypothetical protein
LSVCSKLTKISVWCSFNPCAIKILVLIMEYQQVTTIFNPHRERKQDICLNIRVSFNSFTHIISSMGL